MRVKLMGLRFRADTYLLCLEVKPVCNVTTRGLNNRDAKSALAIAIVSEELRQIVNTQEEGHPAVIVSIVA